MKLKDEFMRFQQEVIDTRHKRYRHYVAARQIGMTYTLAREMVMIHQETQRPQVIIASTLAQAGIYHHYMTVNADTPLKINFELFLKSPKSIIKNKATHEHGSADVYIDNYGYFSNDEFNVARREADELAGLNGRITWLNSGEVPKGINISAQRFRRDDAACRVISLEEAVAGGFDLQDINKLRKEYSPEKFKGLFLC